MTIYHVDLYYRADDTQEYDVMPYDLHGTTELFLTGFYCKAHRLLRFVKWLSMGRLSEKSALKLAQKLNSKMIPKTSNLQRK